MSCCGTGCRRRAGSGTRSARCSLPGCGRWARWRPRRAISPTTPTRCTPPSRAPPPMWSSPPAARRPGPSTMCTPPCAGWAPRYWWTASRYAPDTPCCSPASPRNATSSASRATPSPPSPACSPSPSHCSVRSPLAPPPPRTAYRWPPRSMAIPVTPGSSRWPTATTTGTAGRWRRCTSPARPCCAGSPSPTRWPSSRPVARIAAPPSNCWNSRGRRAGRRTAPAPTVRTTPERTPAPPAAHIP